MKNTNKDTVAKIRSSFEEKTGITVSAGVGPNKLIARLATAKIKPNGNLIVTKDQAENFVSKIPLQKLPGVGPSMMTRLSKDWCVRKVYLLSTY